MDHEYPDLSKSRVSSSFSVKGMTKKNENWISLKEAARISGYSPDYIGELIRKGKIPGKQVICNVAWMTTKEAILEYKERQQKREKRKIGKKEKFFQILGETKRRVFLQFEVLKIFWKVFGRLLIIFFVLILIFSAVFSFSLFSLQKKTLQKELPQPKVEKMEGPTF